MKSVKQRISRLASFRITIRSILFTLLLCAGFASNASLVSGSSVTGSLSESGDYRTYSLTAKAGDSLILRMEPISGNFTPYLALHGPDGTRLWYDYGYNTRIFLGAGQTGQYQVVASHQGLFVEAGDFEISYVKVTGESTGSALVSGVPVDGYMESTTIDTYTAHAVEGDLIGVVIEETGGNYTPRINLYGPTGAFIGGAFRNFRHPVGTTGPYTVVVSYTNLFVTPGSYRLFFSSDRPATEAFVSQKEPDVRQCGPNLSPGGGEKHLGNPINFAVGFKVQRETDYSEGDLVFRRTYRSDASWYGNTVGERWRHNYERRLVFEVLDGVETVDVLTGQGSVETFEKGEEDQWIATDPDITAEFVELTGGGFQYRSAGTSGMTETFSATGHLSRIQRRGGRAIYLAYDAQDRLSTVSSEQGTALGFSYDGNNRVSSVNTPDGSYSYSYDGNSNLVSVANPDGTTRHYHYENALFQHALTGVTDENGVRYATFGYDAEGRAISSEHAGGANKYTFAYNDDDTVSVTNPLDKKTTYWFETFQGVRKIVAVAGQPSEHCSARSKSSSYTSEGWVSSQTDWNGNKTTYSYYDNGLIETVTRDAEGPSPQSMHYSYVAELQAVDVKTEPGLTTDYDYDAFGRVTAITVTDTASSEVRTTTYSYHPNTTDTDGNVILGRLHTVDGPRTDVSDITTYAYDGQNRLISITNPLGHVSQINEFDDANRPTSRTDANGVVTTYAYDALGRVTQMTRVDRNTTYAYDNVGLLSRLTLPDGRYYDYEYDDARRLVDITSRTGEKTVYTLDAAGNRLATATYDAKGDVTYRFRQEFDELSRLRTSIENINNIEAATQYAYDDNDNLEQVTDPYGSATGYAYDGLDRLSITTDAASGQTTWTYDLRDYTAGVNAPGDIQTTYVRNAFGEITSEISLDRGTTVYTYDQAGNLATRTDARGITATFSYDALDRLIGISYPDPSENVSFVFDSNANGAIDCGFGVGRLCRVIDESGTTDFAYDEHGNVVQRVHQELGVSYAHAFEYDAGDQLVQLTMSDDRIVTYGRDEERRITDIDTQVNDLPAALVSNISYRPDGQETQALYGNGVAELHQYDENGRLTSEQIDDEGLGETNSAPPWLPAVLPLLLGGIAMVRWSPSGGGRISAVFLVCATSTAWLLLSASPAHAEVLGYDLNGNIVSRQTDVGTTMFQYDSLQRLEHEQGPAGMQSFTYDANGNRLSDGGGQYNYEPSSNRLTSRYGQAVATDDAGNIIDDGQGLTFEYNQAGRLKRAYRDGLLVATYSYNAFGQRTRKVTSEGTHVYHYDLGGQLIEETSAEGDAQAAYVWRNRTPTAMIAPPGTPSNDGAMEKTLYLHADHLNTPRSATDGTKQVVWRWDSDAFGSTHPQDDVDQDGVKTLVNLRFPGQYFDEESGLHYNYFRSYDPITGRYIESDPIGLAGGENLFAYAGLNPLKNIDYLGLRHDDVGIKDESTIRVAFDYSLEMFVEIIDVGLVDGGHPRIGNHPVLWIPELMGHSLKRWNEADERARRLTERPLGVRDCRPDEVRSISKFGRSVHFFPKDCFPVHKDNNPNYCEVPPGFLTTPSPGTLPIPKRKPVTPAQLKKLYQDIRILGGAGNVPFDQ